MINKISYKQYLDFKDKKSRFTTLPIKISYILIVLTLISFGITSSLAYYYLKIERPYETRVTYLERANLALDKTQSQIDELILSFNVAGVKTKFVEEETKDNPTTAAYFIYLSDLERTVEYVDATQKQIINTKEESQNNSTPDDFLNFNQEFINVLDESLSQLQKFKSQQLYLKDFLTALEEENFALSLVDEAIWQESDMQKIKSYFQLNKENSQESLVKLVTITPPVEFLSLYESQIDYLSLKINLYENILNQLETESILDPEEATQREASYQLYIGASREAQGLEASISKERIRLFDLKENLANFAPIKLKKNSLVSQIDEHKNSVIESQNKFQTPSIVKKIVNILFG